MVPSRQHIIVREEIKFARNDVAAIRESQQNVLSLLHFIFRAGQERVQLLDSRAETEKTRSQIQLNDLSDKLESNLASLDLNITNPDRRTPGNLNRTAVSEVENGDEHDACSNNYRKPSDLISVDKVSKYIIYQMAAHGQAS